MPEGVDEDKFYSQLERVITDKVPTRATAQQIMATIDPTRGSGVKADEIKWSGIEQALASLEKDGKVSKEDLLNYLRNEGRVRFEEVTLGKKDPVEKVGTTWRVTYPDGSYRGGFTTEAAAREAASFIGDGIGVAGDNTKFSQYVLPGGENYREVVLAMPTQEETLPQVEARMAKENGWTLPLTNDQQTQVAKAWREYTPASRNYTSSHFPDIPNYVAHMRTNERTLDDGSEGLFVEEFQSDRHQAGRKKGYAGEDSGEIPDAPFRTTWPIQLFKRALRDAVDGGKDWIGWTTGETQNDRFDLSKSLDSIEVRRIDGSNRVTVYGTNGNNNVITQQSTLEALPDVIGKELAEKVISDMSPKGTPQQIQRAKIAAEEARNKLQQPGVGYDSPLFDEYERKAEEFRVLNGKSDVSYSGLDLKVGGSGMKGFYDNMLPKEVGKYVKQFGGKVEKADMTQSVEADIMSGEEAETGSIPIWKVNITPEMRKISQTGQMRFMPEGESNDSNLKLLQTKETLKDWAFGQANWKDWYSEHQETLDDFFGDQAELFQEILAVTSQAASVKANVGLALKAFGQLMRNEEFDGKLRGEEKSGYLPAVIKNLNAIKNKTQVGGRKISNYKSANEGDSSKVVVDRHIARMLFGVDTPTAKQYAKAESVLSDVAKELGWEPAQVQAALWAQSIVMSGKEPVSYGAYLKSLEAKKLTKKELISGLKGNQITRRIGQLSGSGYGSNELSKARGRYSPASENAPKGKKGLGASTPKPKRSTAKGNASAIANAAKLK
jgi:hypothetical protein